MSVFSQGKIVEGNVSIEPRGLEGLHEVYGLREVNGKRKSILYFSVSFWSQRIHTLRKERRILLLIVNTFCIYYMTIM